MTDEPSDDLEALLTTAAAAAASASVNPQLRQQLREQTSQRVRGYGRWRRVRRLTTLAGVYVAGWLSAWLWLGWHPTPTPAPAPAPASAQPPAAPAVNVVPQPLPPAGPSSPLQQGDPLAGLPADEIELLAEQARERAEFVRLFAKAGDRYLAVGDHVAALRCYRNALERMTNAELAVTSTDSWLLMSLKLALVQERTRDQVRE
jgi:hypothetical protein